MSKSQYIAMLSNKDYLPTINDLKHAFIAEDNLPTDSKEFPWINPEFTKFHVKHRNYQVYTEEFISSLSAYLSQRLALYAETTQPLVVLEVGAGNGKLTKYLKAYIKHPTKVTFLATDSMEWESEGKTSASHDVEKLDYVQALQKFTPTIVLSCWMNIDVNWTKDFIDTPSVKEFVLIGDVLRTAGFGAGWYLPKDSGFVRTKLTRDAEGKRNGIIKGSMGRYDGSPFNPESRTEVYSFIRT